MMKKVCIGLLIILSFGVSIYIYNTTMVFEETRYGNTEVLLFSIPFTLCLVNSSLLYLPRLVKFQGSFSRYKKGIESIFLSISVILFMLHSSLVLIVTGSDGNLVLLIPLSVGIVLITTANTLPRFKLEINKTSSELTQSTHQVWNIVVRPFSLPLFIGGLVMLLCVFLPENLILIGFFSILLCTLLLSIFLSYKAYQLHLNNGGRFIE
ncbi:hypothetical protein QNH20_24485 [Neobacillus sp. WH10]|uniref:hypothetical protein n=1 Tax=Neobacillus sp. WH10 TaxID=3047873 RepID=UPI0024C1CC70|nr:hypothetical protein [Neobacillus sp. WH10]WHY77197.1 hypothetical protein QNH20_24485 [Neobacillus sp. WH10]